MKRRTILLSVLAISAGGLTLPAYATGSIAGIAGATLPEQIVQEGTLVEQYVKQAMQLEEQIQMVYNQMLNLKNLPAALWPDVSGLLSQLVNLVGNAQGLSYNAQNTVAAIKQQYGSPYVPLDNYTSRLQSWSDSFNHQIAGALQQYDLNAKDFQSQEQALAALEAAGRSAQGRMQVLRAGNQIASITANSVMKLDSDIQAGNQVAMNYMQSQQTQQNASNNGLLKMLRTPVPKEY